VAKLRIRSGQKFPERRWPRCTCVQSFTSITPAVTKRVFKRTHDGRRRTSNATWSYRLTAGEPKRMSLKCCVLVYVVRVTPISYRLNLMIVSNISLTETIPSRIIAPRNHLDSEWSSWGCQWHRRTCHWRCLGMELTMHCEWHGFYGVCCAKDTRESPSYTVQL
jgi:hypothetical protein